VAKVSGHITYILPLPGGEVLFAAYGTARPSVDYVLASGTLDFPAGESVATLELEMLDNTVPDGALSTCAKINSDSLSEEVYSSTVVGPETSGRQVHPVAGSRL